jgi:hypothetical protein
VSYWFSGWSECEPVGKSGEKEVKISYFWNKSNDMNFVQHIDADNLTSDFIDYVKKMFKGRKIKLTIEAELDDTAYLMASEANHQRLVKSIKSIKNRRYFK